MTLKSSGFGNTMLFGSSPRDTYRGGRLVPVGTLWGPIPFPCQRTWVNPIPTSSAVTVLLRDWFQVRHRCAHGQEERSY